MNDLLLSMQAPGLATTPEELHAARLKWRDFTATLEQGQRIARRNAYIYHAQRLFDAHGYVIGGEGQRVTRRPEFPPEPKRGV